MSTSRPSTRPTNRRLGGTNPTPTDFESRPHGPGRDEASIYAAAVSVEEGRTVGEGPETDADTLLEMESMGIQSKGRILQEKKGRRRADPLRPSSANLDPEADLPRIGRDSISGFWMSFFITSLSLGLPTLVLWRWLRGNGFASYSTRRGAWLGAALDWAVFSLVAFIAWIGTGESMVSGYVAASVIVVAFVVSPLGFYRGLRGWYTLSDVTRSTYLDLFVVAFVILCLTVFALVLVARSLVRALQYSM